MTPSELREIEERAHEAIREAEKSTNGQRIREARLAMQVLNLRAWLNWAVRVRPLDEGEINPWYERALRGDPAP